MSEKQKRKDDIDQLGGLFLTDGNGKKLCVGSTIINQNDGYSSFLAIDVDSGYSQKINFKIEEL